MKVDNIPGKLFGLFLVVLGAVLIAAYYWTAAGGDLPFSGDKYKVNATVREPQGLQKHADVRAAGVKIGEVKDIQPIGSSAKIVMALEKDLTPIYNDARVLVRQKTLVGENYIDIRRGDPRTGALPDGGTLPLKADQVAVPIDKILNSLDAPTRKRISGSLQGLGSAFEERGSDFNRLAASLRPTLSDGSEVLNALNAQKGQVADLVQQASVVFGALGERRQALRTLFSSAKTTAEAVAERDEALKSAFSEFPGALNQAKSSVAKLSAFSGRATPVVANLRTGLVDLHPVVRDLKPTADSTRELFDRLPALLKVGDPMLNRLRTFSRDAGPSFPALAAFLRQTNPALDYMKPYANDTVAFLSNFGLNHFYDADGALGYCTCPVNTRSFSNWTPAMRKAAGILLDNELITQFTQTHNNPLRKPDSLPRADNDFSGKYPQIAAAPSK